MDKRVVKTSCPRDCFSGCSMNVHVDDGRIVKVEGEGGNRASDGKLCPKGMTYADYVYSANRVLYPMMRDGKRGEGKFKRISWKQAIESVGEKLKSVKKETGPLGVMYYGSGGCQGMLSEYYSGFFSQFGGYTTTRGNLCYSAGIEAVKLTYGEVKHNAPWDLENAKLIILWGKNPAFTNVHEMKFINNAIEKGAKLITIDPIRNASSSKSHLHISPEPGTDMVLALSIMNLLIQRGSIDKDFVKSYTYGFNELKEHVKEYTVDAASKLCKIPQCHIYKMVELIEDTKPMTLICGYGIQRYKNGGQTVRAISMIPAITGDIGVKGGGFRFANKQWTNLSWPYVKEGFTVRDDYPAGALGKAIEGYDSPKVKMLWIERANPLTMHPDINGLKKSMKTLEYIVVVEQFMTDTASFADVILPAQSFFEYDDIFTGYWTPYINYCKKVIDPVGEAKNESQIYRMLGEYMGYNMSYLPIYDIETINNILQKSNIGISVDRLKEGPYIPDAMDDIVFKDRKFNTPSGKIELYSKTMEQKWGLSPLPQPYIEEREQVYPLRFLSTHARERIHSQFHDIDKLKGKDGRTFLYINPEDAAVRGISHEDKVSIYNDNGKIYVYAFITESIKKGTVNVYEGLPEKSGASVNILTNQYVTDIGYGTPYYECFVEVEKCQP